MKTEELVTGMCWFDNSDREERGTTMNTQLRECIASHNEKILQHGLWLAYSPAKKQLRAVVPDEPNFEFITDQLGYVTTHFSAVRVQGFNGRVYRWGRGGLNPDTDMALVMKEDIFSIPGDNRECVTTLAYWLEDRGDVESATWIKDNFQAHFEPEPVPVPPSKPSRRGIFRRRK